PPRENRERARQDFRRVGLEIDAFDDASELLHRRWHFVGAAVLVLVVVEGLGLVRALVNRIGDAIPIVVGIGAAVLILEAVLILGIVGTLVEGVGDAVAIVVQIRA